MRRVFVRSALILHNIREYSSESIFARLNERYLIREKLVPNRSFMLLYAVIFIENMSVEGVISCHPDSSFIKLSTVL